MVIFTNLRSRTKTSERLPRMLGSQPTPIPDMINTSGLPIRVIAECKVSMYVPIAPIKRNLNAKYRVSWKLLTIRNELVSAFDAQLLALYDGHLHFKRPLNHWDGETLILKFMMDLNK